jgi:hypothetical protein
MMRIAKLNSRRCASLTANHDVLLVVSVVIVVCIWLPIGHSEQCCFRTQPRFLRPPLCGDLPQRIGHAWVLQQRLSASGEHRKLGNGLGNILHENARRKTQTTQAYRDRRGIHTQIEEAQKR